MVCSYFNATGRQESADIAVQSCRVSDGGLCPGHRSLTTDGL